MTKITLFSALLCWLVAMSGIANSQVQPEFPPTLQQFQASQVDPEIQQKIAIVAGVAITTTEERDILAQLVKELLDVIGCGSSGSDLRGCYAQHDAKIKDLTFEYQKREYMLGKFDPAHVGKIDTGKWQDKKQQ